MKKSIKHATVDMLEQNIIKPESVFNIIKFYINDFFEDHIVGAKLSNDFETYLDDEEYILENENPFFLGSMLTLINNHLIDYPTPINLNYFWSFGFLAGMCLIIQIISGIFLAMHYVADIRYAFESVEHIMRNVNYGWFLRYVHANGASMFFVFVYCHIFRGLYYGSYLNPRFNIWLTGMIIFLLMMATAFIGYVLPWGQMSLWGATVITSLFSAVPIYGQTIVEWLWGGFSVDNPTLKRFFSLHYLLPFVIVAVAMIHLVLLHNAGSSNPLGVVNHITYVSFFPYFIVKDLFALSLFLIVFIYVIFFFPNALGHPDNYIPANAMVTPAHIVPEWYFLPFYALLRAVPDKLGGVLVMLGAVGSLITFALMENSLIRSRVFKDNSDFSFFLFLFLFLLLGWLGQKPVEEPFVYVSMISSIIYFFFLSDDLDLDCLNELFYWEEEDGIYILIENGDLFHFFELDSEICLEYNENFMEFYYNNNYSLYN